MGNPRLLPLLALLALLCVTPATCDRRDPPGNHQPPVSKSSGGDDPVTADRRQKVRGAMLHAWTSYEKYAWGFDQLRPQTKDGVNGFGGLGVTIVDALDTLYIMGLNDQFQKAEEWVAANLTFNKNYDASVFETTIRIVGGLLSAYDLSGEKVFLDKAKDMADRLLPAWNTRTGIPLNSINLATGEAHNWPWAKVK